MQIKQLITMGTQILNDYEIEDSNIKARVLMQYVMQKTKRQLILCNDQEIDKEKEKVYLMYLQEIIEGKPLQYITHKQEFMGIELYVDENVLIPQPDTEVLVEETIKEIEKILDKQKNRTIRILDLCTGSGAIAISIAKYFQENMKLKNNNIKFEIYALDISQKALEVARKNADKNNVCVTFLVSDMFQKIKEDKLEKFDIIVSNPPYIETDTIQTLSKEVKNEPHLALDGGQDGLDFYKMIAKQANNYLKQERNNITRNRLSSKRKCNEVI